MPLMQLQLKVEKTTKITTKQKTNKILPNIFRRFEVRRKAQLMSQGPDYSMKGKCYVLSGCEQRKKCAWCI